jgi:hypothetical protein
MALDQILLSEKQAFFFCITKRPLDIERFDDMVTVF